MANISAMSYRLTVQVYQPEERYALSSTVQLSSGNMRMVSPERYIPLKGVHLPGILNKVADMESRVMKDQCNWMINPSVFQQIQQSMGPLQIDIFVSWLTEQLPSC